MKRFFLFLLALLLLALAALGWYFLAPKFLKVSVDEVLPSGALVFIHVYDIEKRWNDFEATRLWQNLRGIDIEAILQKSKADAQAVARYRQVKAQLENPAAKAVFMKFFGQEAAVALYPNLSETEENSSPDFLSGLAVVTRLKPDVRIAEFFADVFKPLSGRLTMNILDYKNHKITLIDIPEKNLHLGYTVVKDLLIIGVGDGAARQAIDVLTKSRNALAADKNFLETKSRFLETAKTIGYGNLQEGLPAFFKFLRQSNPYKLDQAAQLTMDAAVEGALLRMSGFRALGFSFVPGEIAKQRLDVIFDHDRLDAGLRNSFSCPSQENKSLFFVPQNVLAYQWYNCYDLKIKWAALKKELQEASRTNPDGPSAEEVLAQFEHSLGLDIERDVLPAFGEELGGFLSDIKTTGFIPIPKLLLFINVLDQNATRDFVGKLNDHRSFVLQSEDYRGTDIHYVVLPFGPDVQPAYAFLGNYLLATTSRSMIKEAIDAAKQPEVSLPQNPDFKSVDAGLTVKNNSVLFFRTDEMVRRMRALLTWAVSQVKAKAEQERAFQDGVRKRLQEVRNNITDQRVELRDLNADLKKAQEDLKNLQAQGIDVGEALIRINKLEKNIGSKEKDIDKSQNDREELEATIRNFPKKDKYDPELMKFYADKLVEPILDGLESYKLLGSGMHYEDKILESNVWMKVEP